MPTFEHLDEMPEGLRASGGDQGVHVEARASGSGGGDSKTAAIAPLPRNRSGWLST